MKHKNKITVIIPVYNAEKTISKTIYSITKQSYSNIEIIIIDDCSTDQSLSICYNFIKNDKRIKVIEHNINLGVEISRITGISNTSGEYICFVDADDWLPNKSLEIMIEKSLKFDADIVVGNHIRVIDKYNFFKKMSKYEINTNLLVTHEEFMLKYYKSFFGIYNFSVTMWGKLYKSEILHGKIPKFGFNYGEDLVFNLKIFTYAKKILFIDDFVYFYRFGGMTTKINDVFLPAGIKMFEIKLSTIDKYKIKDAKHHVFIELKNYLQTFIAMKIRFNNFKIPDGLRNEITLILKNNSINKLTTYFENIKDNDSFVVSLINNNIDEMIQIVFRKEKNNKFKYSIKKYISYLLS